MKVNGIVNDLEVDEKLWFFYLRLNYVLLKLREEMVGYQYFFVYLSNYLYVVI